MTIIVVDMPEIYDAIAADSWEWLQDNVEPLSRAVKAEVLKGRTPEEIRRYVLARVGLHRIALADRCEQAAHHLTKERQQ